MRALHGGNACMHNLLVSLLAAPPSSRCACSSPGTRQTPGRSVCPPCVCVRRRRQGRSWAGAARGGAQARRLSGAALHAGRRSRGCTQALHARTHLLPAVRHGRVRGLRQGPWEVQRQRPHGGLGACAVLARLLVHGHPSASVNCSLFLTRTHARATCAAACAAAPAPASAIPAPHTLGTQTPPLCPRPPPRPAARFPSLSLPPRRLPARPPHHRPRPSTPHSHGPAAPARCPRAHACACAWRCGRAPAHRAPASLARPPPHPPSHASGGALPHPPARARTAACSSAPAHSAGA